MKKKIVSMILACSMIIGAVSCKKADTTDVPDPSESSSEITETTKDPNSITGENLMKNGDFSDPELSWGTYFEGGSGELFINDKQELQFDVQKLGSVNWANQVNYDGFRLYQACVYKMQFDAYATVERDVEYRIQINGSDYHPYNIATIHLTTEVQHFDFVFTMEEESDPAPRLCLNMGFFDGYEEMGPHSVMFDNFDLQCIDDSAYLANSGNNTPMINLNQIGYLPAAEKVAVLNGDAIVDKAAVVDAKTGSSVYEGNVGAASHNAATDRDEARFDFSSFTTPGTYKIVANGIESYEFTIGDDVYDDAFKATLRMFYMQRCGTELTEEFAGAHAHPECHTGMGKIYGTDTLIDVSGGWHDAGDYGRYVVPGAKAAADLMLAYTLYPDAFDDNLDIPESNNGIPDVLDEVRYELEWLFKMQSSEGGVYHKVTCVNFPGFVMPEEEQNQLFVTHESTTATADFAAVMSMASYVYANIDPEFASKCLAAAEKAAEYLESHPECEGAKNPMGIQTGEYPDDNDVDERLWAYAELYKATGNSKYDDKFGEVMGSGIPCAADLGWQGVGAYAGYAYLSSPATGKYKDAVLTSFTSGIDTVKSAAASDAYNSSLTTYPWGSNMSIANNAMYLLLYDDIKGGSDGDEIAREQLNYLLGTNGTGFCFISGFGTMSPERPHHRPSQATGVVVPGMVAGGPDESLEDPYAENVLTGTAPALCYADSDQAYSLNEITIYWNSPVVFLFAYIEANS